ncbi:hypothetical protein EON63_03045 [archaeon]|nr:MAG: hypothetical protein EON63_03045 [archaeon]
MSMAEQDLCAVTEIDPEDPRCARVVVSGEFVDVTDEKELKVITAYTKCNCCVELL